MSLPAITIIRNKDFFENSYQYINFLLNFDYNNEQLKIQQYLWILDYQLSPFEIQIGLQDDKLNPKSHYDILKNDLYGIELYQQDKNKFFEEQKEREFIFEHLDKVDYSQLPFTLSENEIQDIIHKLEIRNMKPFDILSPLNGGQILLEKIVLTEHNILSMPEQEQLKQNVNEQGEKLAQQQLLQEIEILNSTRNQALEEIEKLINNSNRYFLYYFPSKKSINDNVGFKKSGGGYKQKIYEYSNENWNELNYTPLNVLPHLENTLEKDNLKDFKLFEIDFDQQNNQYYIENIYSYSNIEDKDKYDKINDLFTSTYFLYEKRYSIGEREQYESMKSSNPPDIKQMLLNERENTNKMRNLLISKLNKEF